MFQDITFISPPDLKSNRKIWDTIYSLPETNHIIHKRSSKKSKRNLVSFRQVLNMVVFRVSTLGIYKIGFNNSHYSQLNHTDFEYSNYDTYLISEYESKLNIKFLINEGLKLSRGEQSLIVSSVNDPFYYYTDAALQIFIEYHALKIAMVYSSEFYNVADINNNSLNKTIYT